MRGRSALTRILILGANGTIGHTLIRVLSEDPFLDVWGAIRSPAAARHFSTTIAEKLRSGIDANNIDGIMRIMSDLKPDVVINCIGLVKQLDDAIDPLVVLPINAMLPHRLAQICALAGVRLIHFSTDCVFSGNRGNYVETDPMDA